MFEEKKIPSLQIGRRDRSSVACRIAVPWIHFKRSGMKLVNRKHANAAFAFESQLLRFVSCRHA